MFINSSESKNINFTLRKRVNGVKFQIFNEHSRNEKLIEKDIKEDMTCKCNKREDQKWCVVLILQKKM